MKVKAPIRPTLGLPDAQYRFHILRAREMTPEERLTIGVQLRDQYLAQLESEIRATFPTDADRDVYRQVLERLAMYERSEEVIHEPFDAEP